MTAVAIDLLTRPPAADTAPAPGPDDILYVASTDTLLTGCSCSASDDQPY